MKFVIRWKSKVNGRAGRGTKEFEREEAEQLVAELNTEYPDIQHELVEAPPSPTQPHATQPEVESRNAHGHSNPDAAVHALSSE